jgi:hypothetical protein
MDVSGQLQAPAASTAGKIHQYLLNRWLAGIQIRSGRFRGEKNFLLQPEIQHVFFGRPAHIVAKTPTAETVCLDFNISHVSSLITQVSLKEKYFNFKLAQLVAFGSDEYRLTYIM